MQKVDPPAQVIDAFRDVQAARADLERLQNEAQTYANRVVPDARGRAAQILQVAEGYKEQAVAEAKGQSARFLKVYDEYKKAPDVTRQRIYLETMERILGGAEKLVYDGGSVGRAEHRAVSAAQRIDAAASAGAADRRPAAAGRQPMRSPVTGIVAPDRCCSSSSSSATARSSPSRRPNRCWWCGSASRSASSPNRA